MSALDDCLSQEACCSEAMRFMPQVGSLAGIDRWYGRAGCGFMVVPDGTYEEANAGVRQHRNEVRQANGLDPMQADEADSEAKQE